MNASDVIGYVNTAAGGPYVCPLCADASARTDWAAVFPTDETDSPTHCESCEDLIPESLTREGEAYVRDAVTDHLAGVGGRACILRQWIAWHPYLFPASVIRLARTWPATDAYTPAAGIGGAA